MKQIFAGIVVVLVIVALFGAMWYVANRANPKSVSAPATPPKAFHACSGGTCVDADQLQLNPQGTCAVLDSKTIMCGTFMVVTNK